MVTGLAVFLRGIDALEGIEGPDANFLDRSRIGDAQRGKPDQQREAQQPGIADAPLEPPSQYPQSLHGFDCSPNWRRQTSQKMASISRSQREFGEAVTLS